MGQLDSTCAQPHHGAEAALQPLGQWRGQGHAHQRAAVGPAPRDVRGDGRGVVAVQVQFESKQILKSGYHFIGSRGRGNQALSSYGSQLDSTCTAPPWWNSPTGTTTSCCCCWRHTSCPARMVVGCQSRVSDCLQVEVVESASRDLSLALSRSLSRSRCWTPYWLLAVIR
jgi:hypothetical protein